jgi:hypothetical protein
MKMEDYITDSQVLRYLHYMDNAATSPPLIIHDFDE